MKKLSIIIFIIFIYSIAGFTQITDSLKIADKAPDFSLPFATKDSIGDGEIKLSSIIGKKNIVLAFYPADWSGGCTKQLCTMRDNFNALSELNAEIFGISGDYVFSHHEWAKHHDLPFTLLSDHDHKVAIRYNSYNEMRGYNKRTVYLIDKQGKIAYIDLKYNVSDMESFNKLKSQLKNLK